MTSTTIADKVGDDLLDKFDGDDAVKPIHEIKERISTQEPGRSLYIGHVPTPAHEDFMTLANSKFGEDYGATLAFLIEYFKYNEKYRDEYDDIMNKLEKIEGEIE